MILVSQRTSALILVLACSLPACASSQQQGPVIQSSAGETSFAERYPNLVDESNARVEGSEAETARVTGEMPSYPDQLKKTDYALVREVVVKADAAGKSQSYSQQLEENEHVNRFASEEKEKLAQQTGGSVRYALGEKGASSDVVDAGGSAAAAGQQRAIQKQLEERGRKSNPAQRFIEENEEGLGKQNVDTLAKQADSIAFASQLVHVVLPREKQRLEALVSEAGDVKSTLDKSIEEEKKLAAEKGTSARRKKLAETRIKDAEEARARVDGSVEKAKAALESLEKRTKELTDAYQGALDALLDQLDERAKAQPAAEPAS